MSRRSMRSAPPQRGSSGSERGAGRHGRRRAAGKLAAAWLCCLTASLGCAAAAFAEGALPAGGPAASPLAGPLGTGGPEALLESSEPLAEGAYAQEGALAAYRGPEAIEPYSAHPSETRPHAVCPPPTTTRASCMAIAVPSPSKLVSLGLTAPSYQGSGERGGFSPEDLRSAYKFPKEGGEGQTVAIVDAYGYPNAEKDLEVYRKQYKLYYKEGNAACTETDGCFEEVNQKGETGKPPAETNAGWIEETALDLDMVSAACPKCHILLVQANNEALENMLAAVEEAVASAKVVSDSWESAEFSGEAGDDRYLDHAGVPVLFASGDSGYGVEYPSASPDVVAVGGTKLTKVEKPKEGERGWTEEAWSGGGSGCSKYEKEKPAWQKDEGCSNRTVADVSAVASPETPVSFYDSFGTREPKEEGWRLIGGTSVATPLVAGIEAQASKYALSLPGADVFYSDPSALFDVTTGTNTVEGEPCRPPAEDPSAREYECHAGTGYDGPTGNGSPDGPITVTSLPPLAVTRPAASVTGTTATLDAALDAQGLKTTYVFEYGTSTKYGSKAPAHEEAKAGSGTAVQEVGEPITGLTANTTYHYRVVATNSKGVSDGADRTFRTASPTVTGVSPASGPAVGGTTVTVSGTNFIGVSAVKFGTSEAESFKVESETAISAVAPAVSQASGIGTVDVTVATPAGTSATSSADRFTYTLVEPDRAWGEDRYGQLGDLQNVASDVPVEVSSLAGPSAFAAGIVHSLALMPNGTVMAWGYDYTGQLGDGKRRRSYAPSEVCAAGVTECASGPYLEEVTAIAAGSEFSLALLKNGTVMAWGNNAVGELGAGSRSECAANDNICSKVPVPVCTVAEATCKPEHYLKGVVAIAAGAYHSLALLSNGTVVAWGYNGKGQLGDGTSTGPEKCGAEPYAEACSTIPVAVSGLTEVAAIAGGLYNSLALLKNGTVKDWGSGEVGQLGDGATESSDTPVAVCASEEKAPCAHDLGGVKAIAGGVFAGYALLEGGTVKAWGDNDEGELGDGSYSGASCEGYCSTTPVAVKGLSEVSAIAAESWSSSALALVNGATPMAWGGGNYGALGNGKFNESGRIGSGSGNEVDVPERVCAAYASGPCPSGPYLEGKFAAIAVGGEQDLVSFAPPTATTEAASNVTETAATLHGTVNPNSLESEYDFEYGTSESYGKTTAKAPAGSGTSNVEESKGLTSLAANTKYYFRIVATNSGKETTKGAARTFTTGAAGSPGNTALPVASPATPDQAAPETTTNGTWTNEPTSYSYQWQLCNATGGECTNISGATSSTFTPTEADVEHTLRVNVTAKNGVGEATATSNATNKTRPIGEITEYALPSGSSARGIAAGPDKNLWFTNFSPSNKIGKITTSGTITEYALPEESGPMRITAGPDGNLWFTTYYTSKIGKITTSGTITEYSLPAGSEPWGIVTGSDGNLWFAIHAYRGSKIGKITTSGTITEYTLPTHSQPLDIAAGPDGNLWFTEAGTSKIGKITTSGTITEYALPESSTPYGITAGPEKEAALWFTDQRSSKIGKITTSGTITEYALPEGSEPTGIAAGPDKNLWFTEYEKCKIDRITTSGTVTEYALPKESRPNEIAEGSDENMWFTDAGTAKIGKITP
jgi:alpha-tubulin suppressor-like RCC1 family protein/streptogramin lyase